MVHKHLPESIIVFAIFALIGCTSTPAVVDSSPAANRTDNQVTQSTDVQPAAEPAEIPAETEEPGLSLRFVDVAGGTLQTVDFRIYRQGETDSVFDAYADQADVKLEDGAYDVRAKWDGGEVWMRDVTVTAGADQTVEVVLNTGMLDLRVVDVPGGKLQAASLAVYKAGTDEKLWDDYREEQELRLLAGSYDVRAKWDGGEVWMRDVTVTAGADQTVEVVLNTGMLDLRVVDVPGGKLQAASLAVYKAGTDEKLWSDYREEQELQLPAGAYDVSAKWDGGEVWLKDVTVTAGVQTTREVVLK